MRLHAPPPSAAPAPLRRFLSAAQPGAAAAVEPRPRRAGPGRKVLVALGLAVILGVFAVRCVGVARRDSITCDESTHLTHCLHYWMTGDDLAMWELGAPRLPHLVYAWASYQALGGAGMLPAATEPDLEPVITRLVLSGLTRVLYPARCVAVGWGAALLLAVFWAVARTRGAVAGLVATALVSCVPEVLAHSSIAGSDMPFTAAAVLALILLARYAEHPTRGRWLAVALAIGLAWAMRHSALLLLLVAGGVHLGCSLRKGPWPAGLGGWLDRLAGSALASLGLALVAYLVLWAGDGFGTVTLGQASESITSRRIPLRVGSADISGLPIPTSVLSVLKQVSHQSRGHEAYFCGEFRQQGWPLYFPVAFLLKTPVGFVALLVLAAARVRPRQAFEVIAVACLAVLWLTLVRSKVNIGVRYALLTYPLVVPLVARLFEPAWLKDRVWGPLTVAAAVWLGVASFGCHGRYLSYFNELGGGPKLGWLYLADSNIDWGQDFDALAAKLRWLGINDVTTDLSSERHLIQPGLVAIPNPTRELQAPAPPNTPRSRRLYDSDGTFQAVYTRYVAVGVSRLLGLYSRNDMSWLRTRKLVARVGDSIFVFDMDRPADRPFCP